MQFGIHLDRFDLPCQAIAISIESLAIFHDRPGRPDRT